MPTLYSVTPTLACCVYSKAGSPLSNSLTVGVSLYIVVVELADFPSEYIEDGVEPEICAVVTTNNTDSDCVVGFFFEVILSFISTTSGNVLLN